ncbi:hypothetical protein GCM10007853_14800 [Algimonas ampicilliniresistens]|uniref:Activator of Hsp90 ATPase homologue 1/2-like C-terminal domain-containing protein n=1 Tax=Algimonas ampicilliniresistens TaxID=1298735 RepID=A0ABQ5V7U1_9PROT|nr:SRPBCC domain-containing protein [Algimonas ampicilliniresistens]GLQ23606.1 hypothetical protein GCM10007853_14800 [Algimonas ampicilliniresistens]
MKLIHAILGLGSVLSTGTTANAQLRPMIYEEITVDANQADVFSDWTTADGIEAFFAPQATIEAKPGGMYELCFSLEAPKGSCGNDDGRILAIQPDEMLSFTWAMPPYMPEIRPHLTTVQILFEPVDADTTRVRLFHTGFGIGEDWDQGRNYFVKTWPAVLELYRDSKAISGL